MIIDFAKISEKTFANFKDGEKNTTIGMYSDDGIKIMRGMLEPGASIGYHTHETNSEIIYILSGDAKVKYDGEMLDLPCGKAHYCPQGHAHSLINDSDSTVIFFAAVPEL